MDEQQKPSESQEPTVVVALPGRTEERLTLFKKRFDYIAKRLPNGAFADAETYGQLLHTNRVARRAAITRLRKRFR